MHRANHTFRIHRAALILGSMLLTAAAAADDYTMVPEKFIYCTTCHGVELSGNVSVDAPRLNGMAPWYVRNQMHAFKQGWRGTHAEDLIGMEMRPQAASLSDGEIEDAVAFVASVQHRGLVEHTISGDVASGKSLYAACAACHGARGEGNEALGAPALAGQSDWYLVRQLDKYRSGARGYAAEDTRGAQMRASVAVLAGEDAVRDVVAYINSL